MESAKNVRVLLVMDASSNYSCVEELALRDGYVVETAYENLATLALVDEAAPDVVVIDVGTCVEARAELLAELRRRYTALPIVVLSAERDVSAVVRFMRAGATDCLATPVATDQVMVAIEGALEGAIEGSGLPLEPPTPIRRTTSREPTGAASFEGLVGDSPAMQRVYRLASQIAPARATVLITGESGTGKGELARAIHARGPRANGPFVTLQCTALAETLLESELFGHERGAFTGADKRRAGRFEQAHGGTLFLDEIGDIPASTQLKLLRVLQERTFERVGGNEPITVDVRLIAATNRDLAMEVAERRFREDLYYRLNVVHIEMPPLRARGRDIGVLAEHFLARFAAENQKHLNGFSPTVLPKLAAHRWPGNVRELENAIERAVVLAKGPIIDARDIPIQSVGPMRAGGPSIPGATLAEVERYVILTTLEAVGGSTGKAAEILGVSARMIQYRLHQYGRATRTRRTSEPPVSGVAPLRGA